MTIVDKLDPKIPLLIEGESAKSSRAIYLNELLESKDYQIVEPDEKLGSYGMNDSLYNFSKLGRKLLNVI